MVSFHLDSLLSAYLEPELGVYRKGHETPVLK